MDRTERAIAIAEPVPLLPLGLEPMLPTSGLEPFDSPDHIFEAKWDGIRVLAFISGGRVRLQDRKQADITLAFPEIASELVKAIRNDGIVLDGELVCVNDKGIPQLPWIAHRVYGRSQPHPVLLKTFDLLYREGRSYLRDPLMSRRRVLLDLLRTSELVQIPLSEENEGLSLWEVATRAGFDGIIAKEKQGIYAPGLRTQSWTKILKNKAINAVIGGYTLGDGKKSPQFGSLLLGLHTPAGLRYVGSVGGGFTEEDRSLLQSLLGRLHTERSPFINPPHVGRLLYWCDPRQTVQIRYAEVTATSHLRFPIFRGLRPDIDPRTCVLSLLTPAVV